jgi:hypothetical protein
VRTGVPDIGCPEITLTFRSVSASPSVQERLEAARRRHRGTAAMSEDQPADDPGETEEATLSVDALSELVRLAPSSRAPETVCAC